MKVFPEGIRFKYPWRQYQQRVLKELDQHLDDGHLHIVAPPGSGKTVLGLEAAIRINKPTLILSPTITIRNQWIERLCELFLDTDIAPPWISTDIRRPTFLTAVTYQGLHAACCQNAAPEESDADDDSAKNTKAGTFRNKYFEEIVKGLQDIGIGTLIVDEAHHLRNEWWNTLTKVKERLDPVTIGLTATPPYDVSPTEWRRYISLNGPIDSEIPVPELIRARDLCPHQDYVYLSLPTPEEYSKISSFRHEVHSLYEEMCASEELAGILTTHTSWSQPEKQLDWIYSNFDFYSSMLIYLHAKGIEIPKVHFRIIGAGRKKLKIPSMDYGRLENLLNPLLFSKDEQFVSYESNVEPIRKRVYSAGVIERKKVCLTHNDIVDKTLVSSIGKLDSIERIVETEYENLKDELRMVVFTDYIRSEYLSCSAEEARAINRIGVVPIFQRLRYCDKAHKKLGVLTGSLVVLPQEALKSFRQLADRHLLSDISGAIKPFADNFVTISLNDKLRNSIVRIVTQLFQQGEVEILIGTKALLGEGWDAPEINSLVMASFVGSFVLSNQMRGRAIRTSKLNSDKCSNIWHLVCLDPTEQDGGNDIQLMERRFKSFIGVSNREPSSIENGIKRLDIQRDSYTSEKVHNINSGMLAYAADRAGMRQRWHDAIESGNRVIEQIKVPTSLEKGEKPTKLKKTYLRRTIAVLSADLAVLAALYGEYAFDVVMKNLRYIKDGKTFLYVMAGLVVSAGSFMGRQTYKTVKLYLKYRDISKDISNISKALLDSLINEGFIHSDPASLKINAVTDESGVVTCSLEGGTVYEQSLFVDCIEEIVDVIGSPRYIIERYGKLKSVFVHRDFHNIPEILGRKISSARYFASRWQRHVGNCTLIHTRSIEGRKKLLHARVNSLAARLADDKVPEQTNVWR